ncbi:MAG: hypothetical protein AB7P03_25880 [Kofleriaceae bacterium]
MRGSAVWGGLAAAICLMACGDSPEGRTFFERTIQPILTQKCAGNTSGCHSTNPGDPYGFAAGNLDVTSFENIQKRRDTLAPFGAYPQSLFLIKAVGAGQIKMNYGDQFPTIDVQHSGGGILDVGSDAFFTLQSWIENGATENGLKPATPPREGTGACSDTIPPGFDRARYVTPASQPHFDTFKATVQPILTDHGCNAGSCHGAPQSDFYITCGSTDDQLAFNFSQAWSFVKATVADSQLLRVPLAVSAGGRGHTGGDQFAADDEDFLALQAWAEGVGELDFANGDPVKQFFKDNVQKVLLTRGCAFQACHSPQASNDFKLRSGAVGFFSAVALEKNYQLLRDEFMALEFADARRSRAVAKTILADDPRVTTIGGIAHRGGPVLETPMGGPTGAADPANCGAFDPATSSAFCTIQEWLDRERAAAGGSVTPMGSGDPVQIVFVDRNPGTAGAGRLEFDTFSGGADLMVASTQFGANSAVQAADAGAAQSLLTNCTGLTAGTADVQAPEVANDGQRVVFAARNASSEPLGVWMVDLVSRACQRVTPAAADSNGLKIHNFDPVFSPDGSYIVFASTRGQTGPTRSRKRFLPQSDLWRVAVAGMSVDQGSYEQMTFLSNSEIGPQFMREGRVTMTTEKVSDGFYQLSGRRINWDLTDYHPLLAQRKDSLYSDLGDLTQTRPSIGYSSATDIRENSDGNFLLILNDTQADGAPMTPGAAGALAVFNRSIGPFESGRADAGYLPSVHVLSTTTAYRGPFGMPDGTIMVSFASNPATSNFDIVAFNPRTGTQAPMFTNGGGRIRVDAVLAYKYPPRALYKNRRQLVFGGSVSSDPGRAVVHMPDAPLLFTLLMANLRRGRPVDLSPFSSARRLAVYAEGPCPASCSANTNGIFQSRTPLGSAELASDGSVKVSLPARRGVVLELQDGSGNPLVTMTEEHQLGPGEQISMGVPKPLFNAVCGGCHGSISGIELDVGVTPDALTGASQSASATATPTALGQ